MTSEVMSGPQIYRASAFWYRLNDRNRRQIEDVGFESLKRTVNQHYFNWLMVSAPARDYAIPPPWKRVLEREHPVQTDFFGAACRIDGAA